MRSSVAGVGAANRPRPSRMSFPPPLVLYLAVAGTFAVVVLYAQFVVGPQLLQGRPTSDGQFLFDSIRYYEDSSEVDLSRLVTLDRSEPTTGLVPALGFTNSILYAEAAVARTFFPWAPHAAIALINLLLLWSAVGALNRIAASLGLQMWNAARAFLWLNPFIWLNMVSLTKDIWGLFFFLHFALAARERRMVRLAALAILSMLAREWYAGVALAIGLMAFTRLRPRWFLLGLSFLVGMMALAFGVSDLTGYADIRSLELGQRSGEVMSLMGRIQDIPFGHIVVFPVVLSFDLSAWLNSHSYQVPATAWYVHANTISSALFTITLGIGVAKYLRHRDRRAMMRPIGVVLFLYAAVVTLLPVSQHRYLIPAWPLLVLFAFGRRVRPRWRGEDGLHEPKTADSIRRS